MRVSRDQMQANRVRILGEASRLFREKGFDAVSVAEVMKAAGLTHGGFYGHFESKDDLFAQSLVHVFSPVTTAPREPLDLPAFLDGYLSPTHRAHPASGCPTAALASDVRRQGAQAATAMTDGVRAQLDLLGSAIADRSSQDPRRDAIGAWASLVGALVLARAVDDEGLADEILSETKAWVGGRLGLADLSLHKP